jgi:hypothetical protein
MSTELSAVFYFDESPSPGPTFATLLQTIAAHSSWRGQWQKLQIYSGTLANVVRREQADLSTAEAVTAAAPHTSASERISITTSVRAWRFEGNKSSDAAVAMIVEAAGAAFGGTDPRVRGGAMMSATHAGPFCAIVGKDDQLEVAEVNAHVEENLERMMNLLSHCVEALQPRSMKVYTDAGMFLPFNAHAAYFRDAQAVLDDLRWMEEVWHKGLPAYGEQPLAKASHGDAKMLHGWRTQEQRVRLWAQLAAAIPNWAGVTTARVEALLRSQRFDFYDVASGFTVLEYPHYVNAFVDRFYLELGDVTTAA